MAYYRGKLRRLWPAVQCNTSWQPEWPPLAFRRTPQSVSASRRRPSLFRQDSDCLLPDWLFVAAPLSSANWDCCNPRGTAVGCLLGGGERAIGGHFCCGHSPLLLLPMSAYEKGGWTRLHSLCFKRESYGRDTFLWRAEQLALKYGIDCRTNLGNTPLHFACSDPA